MVIKSCLRKVEPPQTSSWGKGRLRNKKGCALRIALECSKGAPAVGLSAPDR